MLLKAWIAAARLRRRVAPGERPREDLVRRLAAGRSFVDVGCMWNINGGIAFAAEDGGATEVTGVDVMAATPEFEAERERRGSSMRFVHGDLHDPATREQVGVHDVVWCSGLVYHAPHPLLSIEALRELTGDTLILASETMPEVPGVPQACVFYPGLSKRARLTHASARPGEHTGLTTPFEPERGYANWFWGISHSALRAMVECTGFEVIEEHGNPFHATLVARRV
jgi:SAM-dependent methyltransferase